MYTEKELGAISAKLEELKEMVDNLRRWILTVDEQAL